MKEKWQDRLRNFSAEPPAGLWNGIERRLEAEQDPASVAERLHGYAPPPPAGLWDKIEQQLDSQADLASDTPVVAMPRRRHSFYAYAAAAAVIGTLLVGTALLLNRAPSVKDNGLAKNDGVQSSGTASATTRQHTQLDSGPQPPSDPVAPGNSGSVAPVAGQSTAASGPVGGTFRYPAAPGTRLSQSNAGSARVATASFAANTNNSIDDDRYMVRAYKNGHTVRFSKKVSEVVDCAEHSTGFSQSLCQVSIGDVQQKMATMVNTDFGGLIERLQDMEKTR